MSAEEINRRVITERQGSRENWRSGKRKKSEREIQLNFVCNRPYCGKVSDYRAAAALWVQAGLEGTARRGDGLIFGASEFIHSSVQFIESMKTN